MLANANAEGPVRARISARSAPAEKNFALPLMMRGFRLRRKASNASFSSPMHARVKRLVPSSDSSCSVKYLP